MLPAGGTVGSAFAGPSWACSAVNWAGVSVTPDGFSGPVTCVNRPLACSFAVAAASGAGCSHTGVLNLNIGLVGFADDCGKYLFSSVCPAAESVPEGGAVFPPKPAAV